MRTPVHRVSTTILIALAAFALTGCGSAAPKATREPAATTAPTTRPTERPTAKPTLRPAPPAATAAPTVAQMLARVNAYDSGHMDLDTDQKAAEAEFQRILDCIVKAYAGTANAVTEQQAGDTLYKGWSVSGKGDTLLSFAQAFC